MVRITRAIKPLSAEPVLASMWDIEFEYQKNWSDVDDDDDGRAATTKWIRNEKWIVEFVWNADM